MKSGHLMRYGANVINNTLTLTFSVSIVNVDVVDVIRLLNLLQ